VSSTWGRGRGPGGRGAALLFAAWVGYGDKLARCDGHDGLVLGARSARQLAKAMFLVPEAEYDPPMSLRAKIVLRALGAVARARALGRALSGHRRETGRAGGNGGDAQAEPAAPRNASASSSCPAGHPVLRRGVYRDAAPRRPSAPKRAWPPVGKHKYGYGEFAGVPPYVAIAARQMCPSCAFSVHPEGEGWLVSTLNPSGIPSRWRDEAYIAADGTVHVLPDAMLEEARWFPDCI
jgi:hypothetical protein